MPCVFQNNVGFFLTVTKDLNCTETCWKHKKFWTTYSLSVESPSVNKTMTLLACGYRRLGPLKSSLTVFKMAWAVQVVRFWYCCLTNDETYVYEFTFSRTFFAANVLLGLRLHGYMIEQVKWPAHFDDILYVLRPAIRGSIGKLSPLEICKNRFSC